MNYDKTLWVIFKECEWNTHCAVEGCKHAIQFYCPRYCQQHRNPIGYVYAKCYNCGKNDK